MDLLSFLGLSETMAIREVLDQVLKIEAVWDNAERRQKELSLLHELLATAASHRSETLRKLSQYSHRIPVDPSYHQFMSIVVPIERQYSRAIADADFLVSNQDRDLPRKSQQMPMILVLDNIRSAFNLGSIWRLAECFGVQKIYVTGYTATPEQAKVSRAALGTEQLIKWEWRARVDELLVELRGENYHLVAMETSQAAHDLNSYRFEPKKTAIFLGNERYGFEPDFLRSCDTVIEIPCWGRKNSLNVAVASGVIVNEIRRQWLAIGYV